MRAAWVKELQNLNEVMAVKVGTKENIADLLTKCHSGKDFARLRGMVRVRGKALAT